MASLDMFPQYVIDDITQYMEAIMMSPAHHSPQGFLAFIRRSIGDFETFANGQCLRISDEDMNYLRPSGWDDKMLEILVQAALDIKMKHEPTGDYYTFWFDPL